MMRATRRSFVRHGRSIGDGESDELGGLQEVDLGSIPVGVDVPRGILRAFSGREITVQVYEVTDGSSAAVRLSIRRHDGKRLREHWRTLQRVKEALYPGNVGFEVFPRTGHVIDKAPMWHLWILPEGTGLGVSLDGVAP